jgi:hypothetical protein
MSSSRQAQKERYWTLKRAGLCTTCGTNPITRFARCDECHEHKKHAKPTTKMTPSSCFVGEFCAIALKDALEALGLRLRYSDHQYIFAGADSWVAPRTDDSTPYDALRYRGHLEREKFTRKIKAWRKSKKQSEMATHEN